MGHYRKVGVGIWEGEIAAFCRQDPERWIVFHYLMTNRHNFKGVGFYLLPLVYIADATGLGLETCRRRVRDASETGFARYDETTRTVFVVEGARHEWGEQPNPARNDVKSLAADLRGHLWDLRKSPLINDFLERYGAGWAPILGDLPARLERIRDASGTHPGRIPRGEPPDPDPDPDPDPEREKSPPALPPALSPTNKIGELERAHRMLTILAGGGEPDGLHGRGDVDQVIGWLRRYRSGPGDDGLESDLRFLFEEGKAAHGVRYVHGILRSTPDQDLGRLREIAVFERRAGTGRPRRGVQATPPDAATLKLRAKKALVGRPEAEA